MLPTRSGLAPRRFAVGVRRNCAKNNHPRSGVAPARHPHVGRDEVTDGDVGGQVVRVVVHHERDLQ